MQRVGYAYTLGQTVYRFPDLKDLLAKATPHRSGDVLAGIAAATAEQRMAARMALADLPLARLLEEAVVPYEDDEVTRLIADTHDRTAFAPVAHLAVGDFRNWLLADTTDAAALAAVAPGLTPEMAAAVSKLMRNQDLILVARKCRVVTRFRNTIGLPGRLSVRIQPNHPTDDARGIAASVFDGLLYGCGDAVIGINPAGDGLPVFERLWRALDELIGQLAIPTQSCVLTHVTNQIRAIGGGASSPLWLQLQADVYGATVQRLAIEEGAAYGAALLGHVAGGTFSDVDEAAGVVRTLAETTEPDPEHVAVYEDLFAIYTELYPTLREEMHRLAGDAEGA